jgi:hypothetical protein
LKKIRRCKINKALQNKLSVAKYTKRCKINLALQNKYENKLGVAK